MTESQTSTLVRTISSMMRANSENAASLEHIEKLCLSVLPSVSADHQPDIQQLATICKNRYQAMRIGEPSMFDHIALRGVESKYNDHTTETSVVYPPSNKELRALYELINTRFRTHDTNSLLNLSALVDTTQQDPDQREWMHIHINDSIDTIDSTELTYRLYDNATVNDARQQLQKAAYGNFAEAGSAMCRDLEMLEDGVVTQPLESPVYLEHFFTDTEQKVWRRGASLLQESRADDAAPEQFADQAKALRDEIRRHLQAYFGQLIPAYVTTYQTQSDGKTRVVSCRIYLYEDKASVAGADMIRLPLQRYFDQQASQKDALTPPHSIDGFTLSSLDTASYFAYEI